MAHGRGGREADTDHGKGKDCQHLTKIVVARAIKMAFGQNTPKNAMAAIAKTIKICTGKLALKK
ncbi:hypothetical protein V5T82_07150 [Magnetovibrio sp. PR-2]|uniref:hypothetical protein n=1 Tax=Magnetovibrio sp. PR-2 TaxID=3120356 RepID=UPI002FCE287C